MEPDASRPRAVETPLPVLRPDAPHDVELGITTSDDTGWGSPAPRATTTTPSVGTLATLMLLAGGFKARYIVLKRGWHRRRL